jgi:hypothetical protein
MARWLFPKREPIALGTGPRVAARVQVTGAYTCDRCGCWLVDDDCVFDATVGGVSVFFCDVCEPHTAAE